MSIFIWSQIRKIKYDMLMHATLHLHLYETVVLINKMDTKLSACVRLQYNAIILVLICEWKIIDIGSYFVYG